MNCWDVFYNLHSEEHIWIYSWSSPNIENLKITLPRRNYFLEILYCSWQFVVLKQINTVEGPKSFLYIMYIYLKFHFAVMFRMYDTDKNGYLDQVFCFLHAPPDDHDDNLYIMTTRSLSAFCPLPVICTKICLCVRLFVCL